MTQTTGNNAAPCTGILPIGSLSIHVSAPSPVYLEDLAEIYCTTIKKPGDLSPIGLHLEIVEAPARPPVEVPPDGLIITSDGELHTEAIFAQTAWGGEKNKARLTVFATDLVEDERRIYLVVLLNKILFWMGYTRLHASAISTNAQVNTFIGDRGAGKSSICAYLAGRGGLVLADDDVMLHCRGDTCVVSGCDETMRIMADAEKHLFGQLDAPVLTFGGVPKKQIFTAERFATQPYVDHDLSRMFFPRVGERFSVKPLPPSQLVMRLMHTLAAANRFAGAKDHAQTLDFLTNVASRVAAYELVLSPDFRGLDKLYDFLESATD